ncbi:alpha/beta hydrolase fold-containing protein [Oscillochloris trichoides DG-6]|uniref:Alpha/beta hydrolase fold-containing protein n=1 Tax=Oscillochloris trichoides DG-6 TaxID=765420 RepID=E1IH28_9CHLR|nr:alpha/beta hydrolase [Oscillochloris trichoides]EFO79503.1 alpha/beta hydrolase fold-containing protein [Oscillochloris trichoides DG-6]
MSAIHLDNRLVHYEVFGRGQPIIFLHSWLGSWRYWVPTMDLASERYRAYALDFWGYGESDRRGTQFTISSYVDMLNRFIEQMGIPHAYLVGHGMGGMVAIRAARENPERFTKVMSVCTPLYGQVLSNHVKPGTFSKLLGRSNPTNVWTKIIRSIPIADTDVQKELYEDTESLSETVLSSVQESLLDTDLRSTLATLNVPLLAVYGGKDVIVNDEHAQFINELSERPTQLITLPKANHFPFLEQSNTFSRLLLDFLVSQGSPVEIKEEWRRRVNQREYL